MFVSFDPRPNVEGDDWIIWNFRCQWCNAYWPQFFISAKNIPSFKCTCGQHPLTKYKFS